MDQLRPNAKVLFTVLFISQVCGIPTFYWSQPDCYREANYESYNTDYGSYQGPDYQGTNYQGPSYQETLRGMIEETLKAVSEIVQITVKATKNELAELTNIWSQNIEIPDCNSDVDYGDTPNVAPDQNIAFQGPPMDSTYDMNPNSPESQDPGNMGIYLTSTENKPCNSSESPALDNKTGVEHNESLSSQSEHKPNHQSFLDVQSTKSPEQTTSITESTSNIPTHNNTHEENSNDNASVSTVALEHNGSVSSLNTLVEEMLFHVAGGGTTEGVSHTTYSADDNKTTETSTVSVFEEMSTFNVVTGGSKTDGTTDAPQSTSVESTVSTSTDELTSTSFTTEGPSTEDIMKTTTISLNDSSIREPNSTTAFELTTKPSRKSKL